MNAKKRGLVLASRLGFDQELIDIYDEFRNVSWGEFPIDEEIRNYELTEDERKGDVLLPLIPAHTALCYRFGALGHVFRTRGYRPVILYDDNTLPTSPILRINKDEYLKPIQDYYRTRQFLDTFGFESVAISKFVMHGDYDILVRNASDGVSYRGVPLTDCAKASTRKYFKRYSLDLSDRNIREKYEDFVRGAAMIVDASKEIFDE